MKFFMKHKVVSTILGVILLIIIIGYMLLSQFMPDLSKSEYGDRLDGINKEKISSQEVSKMKSEIGGIQDVKKVTYHLKGRLINIIIDVKDGMSLDNAKSTASKVLDYFKTSEKEFYDIQVFVTCDSNSKNDIYPVIGYKNKTSDSLVWKQ